MSSVDHQLKELTEKLDRVLELLQTRSRKRTTGKRSNEKPKIEPPNREQTAAYQEKFESLFARWDSGEEFEVENELNKLDANEIRRFADANNLNVTSKTPKSKVLRLVAGRFRERRQLIRSHFQGRAASG